MHSVLSIRDLIAEIVRHLWIVIACAVLFGVLLAGYKYTKDLSTSKQVVEEVDLTDLFTDEEINQINTYVALKNRYLNYVEHVYSIPIMELNAHNVDTVSLQYLLVTQDSEVKDDISSSYVGYIRNGNLAQDVAEAYEEWNVSDVQSMIFYVTRGTEYIQTEITGVIELKVWGRTEEESVALAEAVKECISEYSATLASNNMSHRIDLLDESSFKNYDNDLYSLQVSYTSDIDKELAYVESQESVLNSTQLAVANEYIESEEDVEDDADLVSTKVGISKKYLVLGVLLGFVASAGIIVAWYVLTATIKFSEEIRMVYGIRYLGQISFKKKNVCETLADKLFYSSKLQSLDNQKELLCSKILITCETEGIKEFVLTGNFGKNKDYIFDLQKKLSENGISMKVVGDILKQPDALNELKGEKNIMFVETIKKSRYENIHQEIVLCDEQSINVLGYIIFE